MNELNVKNLIDNANSIAIVPSKVAGADAFCAAVGLYFMIRGLDKEVELVYPGKIPQAGEGLIDSNFISSNLSQRELVVEIDYSGTPATQAHYTPKGDKLEVRVGPVPLDFDKDRVNVKLEGFDFDVIFVIGAQSLDDLGSTARFLRKEFANAKIINIDHTKSNEGFGDVNINNSEASSLSFAVHKIASEWGITPTEKSARAILTGMTYRSGLVVANS